MLELKCYPVKYHKYNVSRGIVYIYADGIANPATIVPITLELHGKVLRIADINIEERKIDDPKQANTLRIIDGQTIYGMMESQGVG